MTLLQLVERERARLRAAAAATGAVAAIALAAIVLALGTVALGGARWISRPAAPLALWLVVAALVALAAWWSGRLVRRTASRHAVAEAIERERTLRAGSLRGAMEVADAGTLGRMGAETLGRQLEGAGARLAPVAWHRAVRRAVVGGGAAVLGLVLFGAARAASPDGWTAIAHPVRALTGTLLPRITFVNPPRVVLRGETVLLRLRAPARRALTLDVRATGAGWSASDVPVADGEALVRLGPLDADLAVVAGDGRTTSDTLAIRVTDRPFLGGVSMRATYPAYLGRAPEILPVGEPAVVPRGTRIHLTGRASTLLRAVALASGRDTLRLTPSERAFSGELEPRESGRWTWRADGVVGAIPDLPAPLDLVVVPDSAPHVDITVPAGDTIVAAADRVTLDLTAADDHGLASVSLRSWRQGPSGQPMPEVVQRLATDQPAVWSGEQQLDLAARGLEPGDALHVVATAVDNSPWAQAGSSRELVIRIPSLEERRAAARALADSAVQAATSAAGAEQALAEQTEQASRSRGERSSGREAPSAGRGGARGGQPAMSYESAERVKSLVQQQRALVQQIQQVQRAAAALEQQLRETHALDSTLARELHEAQAMLQQALTPELMAQLQRLEGAAQQLSPDQAREALKNLAAMQQQLREQLERSAEMLKRAAYEGAMQTLHDEASEIARRERALSDSMAARRQAGEQGGHDASDSAGAAADSAAAREARALGERSARLTDQVRQLSQRLAADQAQEGARRAQQAATHADASTDAARRAAGEPPRATTSGTETQPQQVAKAGGTGGGQTGASGASSGASPAGGRQSGAPQSGGQQGGGEQGAMQDAAQEMDAAAQQLAQARAEQIAAWKGALEKALDQSIQETLQMSRTEARLADRARQSGADMSSMRGEQSAVELGLKKSAERLDQASRQSSLVGSGAQRAMADAQRAVADATREVADAQKGSTQSAASALDEAADALNQAAAALVRDRGRVASAQSASGFPEMLQQMQAMAKKQGQLNAAAAGLFQMGPGQGAQMGEAARALARQQRELARQLEEMGDGPGGGRAQELAKEAQAIADALDRGRIDASTLQRQQELFHRMLDAGRSLEQNEREDQKVREAQSAVNPKIFTPTGTDASGKPAQKFRAPTWDELRGLTPEERRAVLDYFSRINGGPQP